jgi:hypothetical protein
MAYRQLFLLVEGEDDARFFEHVVIPLLLRDYQRVEPVQIRAWPKEKLKKFLHSVEAMDAEYLLVGDLDFHPCVTAAKEVVVKRQPFVEPARVQIVKAEIESWYCAGIPDRDAELGSLRIATCTDTSEVTKEAFNAAIGQKAPFRIPFLISLLERFDLETAARRNASFRYFARKHLNLPAGA